MELKSALKIFQRLFLWKSSRDLKPSWMNFPREKITSSFGDAKIALNLSSSGRLSNRGVTIRVPHDTIRISIQRSRYNTYLDTYLNTVRCQRDVMSSMKAETPVIRSPAHNLLLQWMEYLLLQLPMLSQDVTLLSYIRVFPSIWSEKTMCSN